MSLNWKMIVWYHVGVGLLHLMLILIELVLNTNLKIDLSSWGFSVQLLLSCGFWGILCPIFVQHLSFGLLICSTHLKSTQHIFFLYPSILKLLIWGCSRLQICSVKFSCAKQIWVVGFRVLSSRNMLKKISCVKHISPKLKPQFHGLEPFWQYLSLLLNYLFVCFL